MPDPSNENQRRKVSVRLSEVARGGGPIDTETLWAEARGRDAYELLNVPFLAYNLNLGDLVQCVEQEDGSLLITDVLARSGAHTIRLFASHTATDEQIATLLSAFGDIPVTIEKGRREHWAVAVKTDEGMQSALERLEAASDPEVFGFETGYHPAEPWANAPGG